MPVLIASRRLLLSVLATPLLLAGCSGAVTVTSTSSGAAPSSGPVASATIPTPTATLAGGSGTPVAPQITGTAVQGKDLGDAIRSAVQDAKTVRMAMTTQAGTGTAAVDLEHRAVRIVAGQESAPVTLVHRDGRSWVKGAGTVTATATPTPSGTVTARPTRSTRTWLELRGDGTDVLSRKLGAAVDVEAMLRPTAFTSMLDGLVGDQTKLDGGTRTSFWVQPDAYVAAINGSANLANAITAPVTLVVELDGHSRPMKLTATIPTGRTTVVDETRYTGWDEPVMIEAPAPGDVAPAPAPRPGDESTPGDESSETAQPTDDAAQPTGEAGGSASSTAHARRTRTTQTATGPG